MANTKTNITKVSLRFFKSKSILWALIISTILLLTILVGVLGYAVLSKNKLTQNTNIKFNNQNQSNTNNLNNASLINSSSSSNNALISQSNQSVNVVNDSSCNKPEINTLDEFKKSRDKTVNDLTNQILEPAKKIMTAEEYKIFSRALELGIKNQRDTEEYKSLNEGMIKIDSKYPTLRRELEKITEASPIITNSVLDVILQNISLSVTYGDYDYSVVKSISPQLYSQYILQVIAGSYGVRDVQEFTFRKLFSGREYYFVPVASLKDLTPNKLLLSTLCRIKYDLNTNTNGVFTDDEQKIYPLNYTAKLGREQSLKQIDKFIIQTKEFKKTLTLEEYGQYSFDMLHTLAPFLDIDVSLERYTNTSETAEEQVVRKEKRIQSSIDYFKYTTRNYFTELENIYRLTASKTAVYNQGELPTTRQKLITNYINCLDNSSIKYTKGITGELRSHFDIDVDNSDSNQKLLTNSKCKETVEKEFKKMYSDYMLANPLYDYGKLW